MTDEEAAVVNAARRWVAKIQDPPNLWADKEDFDLIAAVSALDRTTLDVAAMETRVAEIKAQEKERSRKRQAENEVLEEFTKVAKQYKPIGRDWRNPADMVGKIFAETEKNLADKNMLAEVSEIEEASKDVPKKHYRKRSRNKGMAEPLIDRNELRNRLQDWTPLMPDGAADVAMDYLRKVLAPEALDPSMYRRIFGEDRVKLPLLDPPPPGSFPTVVCPSCGHGIDPHGVDPGSRCGVGDENAVPCACFWSPNDIAADLMQLTSVKEPRYDRDRLVTVLVAHQRMDNGGGCLCGWDRLGASYADHVTNAYEAAFDD